MIGLIIKAVLVLAGLAILLAVFLYFASKRFEEKEDTKLKEIVEALPGANCGACGFAGCKEYARAVIEGKAKFDSCKAGREEVALKIRNIMQK